MATLTAVRLQWREEVDMPLTDKGKKILRAMKKQYGAKKGKEVFYASANAKKIKGVHGKKK